MNKEIVGLINRHGGKAVGLCGKDGNLISAEKYYLSEEKQKDTPRRSSTSVSWGR